ncbi:hypothetical protein, partial [Klebsiella michiganensis]|uniref:hypothetical protein n=1 Tax=Klebsiella michiganensis TaxID=1134687 RepID=UPI001FFD62C4
SHYHSSSFFHAFLLSCVCFVFLTDAAPTKLHTFFFAGSVICLKETFFRGFKKSRHIPQRFLYLLNQKHKPGYDCGISPSASVSEQISSICKPNYRDTSGYRGIRIK